MHFTGLLYLEITEKLFTALNGQFRMMLFSRFLSNQDSSDENIVMDERNAVWQYSFRIK